MYDMIWSHGNYDGGASEQQTNRLMDIIIRLIKEKKREPYEVEDILKGLSRDISNKVKVKLVYIGEYELSDFNISEQDFTTTAIKTTTSFKDWKKLYSLLKSKSAKRLLLKNIRGFTYAKKSMTNFLFSEFGDDIFYKKRPKNDIIPQYVISDIMKRYIKTIDDIEGFKITKKVEFKHYAKITLRDKKTLAQDIIYCIDHGIGADFNYKDLTKDQFLKVYQYFIESGGVEDGKIYPYRRNVLEKLVDVVVRENIDISDEFIEEFATTVYTWNVALGTRVISNFKNTATKHLQTMVKL